jgi:hypothetical protein
VIAGENKKSRLTTGKAVEQQIADLMMPLFKLEVRPVTEARDRQGVDRLVVTPRNNVKTLQIKYRETGTDILVDAYDPYYGTGHSDTKIGRDLAYQCDFVACLIGEYLHLIHGEALKRMVRHGIMMWYAFNKPKFLKLRNGITTKLSMDHRNMRPKLLVFVPIKAIPKRHIWTKNILTGETVK